MIIIQAIWKNTALLFFLNVTVLSLEDEVQNSKINLFYVCSATSSIKITKKSVAVYKEHTWTTYNDFANCKILRRILRVSKVVLKDIWNIRGELNLTEGEPSPLLAFAGYTPGFDDNVGSSWSQSHNLSSVSRAYRPLWLNITS